MNASKPRVAVHLVGVLVAALLWGMFPAPTAYGEELKPWERDAITVSDLEKLRDEAQKKAIELGEVDAKSDAGKWKNVHQVRVAIINDYLRAVTLKDKLPSPVELSKRKDQADKELKNLLCGVPPGGDEAAMSRKSLEIVTAEIAKMREQMKQTTASLAAWRADLEFIKSGLDELPPLAERVRKRVQDPKAELSSGLDKYKRENDQIFLRAASDRMKAAGDTLGPLTDTIDTLKTEEERDQNAIRVLQFELEHKQNQRADDLREKGEVAIAEAESKAAEAKAERDPFQRVLKSIEAQGKHIMAQAQLDRSRAARIQRTLERERRRVAHLERQSDTVKRRFGQTSDISADAAERVVRVINNVKDARDDLERNVMPAWRKDRDAVLGALAEVEHRLDDLASPFDESEIRRDIHKQLAEDGVTMDSAMRKQLAFALGIGENDGMRGELRHRADVLAGMQGPLKELGGLLDKRLAQSDKLLGSVTSRLYRIRSDAPFGIGTFSEAAADAARLPEVLAEPSRVSAFFETLRTHKVRLISWLIALLSLFMFSRWLRNRPVATTRARGFWHAVSRLVGVVLRTCTIPLGLIALSYGVGWLGLPAGIAEPSALLLRYAGIFLALIALGSAFFGPGRFAEREWGMSPALGHSLKRFVCHSSLAGLCLLTPAVVLSRAPFKMAGLSRVLYTAFLLTFCYQLVRLLWRKRAFSEALSNWSPFWRRALPLVRPLIYLVLGGIIVGELMGYRLGSAMALGNIVQTIVTVLLLIGLYLVVRGSISRAASSMRRANPELTDAESGEHISDSVVQQLTRLSMGVAGTLAVFLLADFWGLDDTIRGFLSEFKIHELDEERSLTLWEVAKALVWIAGAHFLVGNLGAFLESRFVAKMKTGGGSGGYVLLTFARYALLFFAYAAALLTMGFRFADIGWLLAAFSVGIGFGLQEIVANFISGIILLLERPVRIGDAISVGDTWGIVERINVRATHVTNRDNQEIIVPNKNFITQEVTNWSRKDRETRGRVQVGVAYGTDLEKVVKILTDVVRSERRILKDPKPKVLFSGFGDSSLDFTVLYYADVEEHIHVRSDLGLAINKAFREHKIEIPFPQRDLHIKEAPGGASVVPPPQEERTSFT